MAIEYKCPCCGGAIEFDSKIQKLKCPYCDTEFEIDALDGYNQELRRDQEKDEMDWQEKAGGTWKENEQENIFAFHCQSCGAGILGTEQTGAVSCPYCGNHMVQENQFAGDLRPDYVIPFKLDKKAAKTALKRHLSGKKLLPKVFQDENHLDKIQGVYVPFWLFDTDTEAYLRYRGTKVRVWSDSRYNYTDTSYYSVVREGKVNFRHVPVDGSSQMPNDLMESIEPFDFSEAVEFHPAYLAGFLADRYDVGAEESEERANERIRKSAGDVFASTIHGGYASLTEESNKVRFSNSHASYALFPVWILNTTWQGNTYLFAMNGQTGKFVGDLPLDKGIYRRWLAGLTLGIGALVYGVIWLMNLL
ncbi:MAG: hypothetical protein PUB22_05725 [Clostridiales bacterium]|nr:hypothetical protein [Clostridiales bacterium]